MPTVEYYLFRVKFIRPRQSGLFHDDRSPRDMFRESVCEKPSDESRRGDIWHIGNIRHFTDDSGYFAVGRTTLTSTELYDEGTGDFLEKEATISPYTHCVFDASIGLLGIARKSRLAPTAKGVASRVRALLERTSTATSNEITVEISPIRDPTGFLLIVRQALRVVKFTASFTGPNPFDADEHFQKPLSVYLQAANGSEGKAEIKGEDLDRSVVQQVARSTAATGSNASARVQRTEGEGLTTVSMKGDPIKRSFEEDTEHEEILSRLVEAYREVRTHD